MTSFLKKIAVLCALLPSLVFAQTPTPNIGLKNPAYGTPNWQTAWYFNTALLDQLLSGNQPISAIAVSGAASIPQLTTWQVGTTYASGAIVFYLGNFYASLSNGNVGHLPTNPAYWTSSLGTAVGTAPVVVLSQCTAGSDAFATLNNCASLIPNGGVIDARGFGAQTLAVTTQLTALSVPSRPILIIFNQATVFTLNIHFSTALINANIASQISGTSGACMIPIANNSFWLTPGYGQQLNLQLGASAATYDVVCNATMDGTQESIGIDGMGIWGHPSATMKGSLLHIVKTYIGTFVSNFYTYQPFGNAATLTGGSDQHFFNDNFSDSYEGTTQYPGAVLTINCGANYTFSGGAVQHNGPFNPLIVTNNCDTTTGLPTQGAGYQTYGLHFYNTDFEIRSPNVGTCTGCSTNVDPFQFLDPSGLLIDDMNVSWDTSSGGTGIVNLVDLGFSGANGQLEGPVDLSNIVLNTSPQIVLGGCTVHNASTRTTPQMACVHAGEDGSNVYQVGRYRWAGSGATQASTTDYLDYVNMSGLTSGNLNIIPSAYSSLPACVSGTEGQLAPVTDSTVNTWGATISGGGTFHVLAYCDGTNWSVSAL
jgi:hypothetical protein